MTVGDLIQYLRDFDNDREVRLAMQPDWPLEYAIADVFDIDEANFFEILQDEDGWYVEGLDDERFDLIEEAEKHLKESRPEVEAVYLTEGRQIGYLPGAVSKALGWR